MPKLYEQHWYITTTTLLNNHTEIILRLNFISCIYDVKAINFKVYVNSVRASASQ